MRVFYFFLERFAARSIQALFAVDQKKLYLCKIKRKNTLIILGVNRVQRIHSHCRSRSQLNNCFPNPFFPFLSFCLPFIFTLLLFNKKHLSGRDIICFPNALFISDRDLVQSFESRHGRYGNSNPLLIFAIYRENNHCFYQFQTSSFSYRHCFNDHDSVNNVHKQNNNRWFFS